ncbi:MAG: tetratricopeptide repeat protein [Planctomycetes bacterium]|nr:tetratricopeptide repeat protein [Planctomycetota bacterium]
MRVRTLLAIVCVLCALPVLASDQRLGGHPDTLVMISDARLDAAFDERTKPEDRPGLIEKARAGYESALRADAKNQGALLGLARLYARTGQKEDAVAAYKGYLAHYPKDAAVVHEVAIAHANWKDWAQATAWCEFALKIDPEARDVKLTLGLCLAFGGRCEDGCAVLCQIMPEPQARLHVAGVLLTQGKHDARDAQLRLALKADPTYRPALDLLRDTGALAQTAKPVAPGAFAAGLAPPLLPFVPGAQAYGLTYALIPLGDRVIAYKLRNAAAADVAHAFAVYSQGKGWAARIDCDAANNNVIIAATGAVHAQFARLVSELDRTPAQVLMQVTVIQVPRSFIATSGLNAGGAADATTWTLSAREVVMFNGLLREAKEKGRCDILSRPQIQLCDGQTGFVQVGQQVPVAAGADIKTVGWVVVPERAVHQVPVGLTTRFTPHVSPDGKNLTLATEAQLTELLPGTVKVPVTIHHPGLPYPLTSFTEMPACRTESLRASTNLKFGETLVAELRGPASSFIGRLRQGANCAGPVTLLIVTPHLVQHAETARPAAGWFVK